jgi:putative heme-binding domain-containing protein
VGGTGKDVGPNLSAIGAKLPAEALLVAILDPSAGISHNYETFIATTEDGRTVNGLLVSRSDDEVVIKDAAGVVHTLAAAEVEELTKSPLSLMPSGLEKTMTAQELADLVAYLVSLKTP